MATNNAINQIIPTGFSAYLSASTANDKTGDGTAYDILFDTITSTDGNYNAGTGTYTVVTPGIYYIQATVTAANIGAAHTAYQFRIVTTPGSFFPYIVDSSLIRSNFNQLGLAAAIAIPLTAAQTIKITIVGYGSTKTIGFAGSADSLTWIRCYRVA